MPNPLKAAARGLRKFVYSTWGAFGGGSGGATGFRFVLPDDIDTRAVRRRPFENSVVSVCVNFLAAAVSDLDIYVHRDKGKGKNKAIEGHALVKLLDRPNPYHTYSDLWHDTIREWTSGNAYWVKVRSGSGAVVQVIPVVSESMVPISYDPTELITHYRYTAAGVIQEFPRSEVVHFRRGSDPANPQHGLSPYHALGRELFTDNALAGMKASLSHNLGMPGLLISTVDPNANIHEDDIEEIRKRARERTTGRDRGKPWVMRGAWKVDKLSWNLREMDASNWSQEPAERLCAALGLNAMAVNLPTKDRTYANFEEANQSAWRKGVLPLLDFLSVTLDTQLLPDLGDPGTQRVCFDADDVVELREDQKALYDRVVAVYKGEILKRSEAREEIGYDSGPEDDVYFIGAGETPDVPPAGTIDGNPAVQVAAAQAPGGKPPGDGGANGKATANGKPKAKQPAAKAFDGATDGRRGDATGPGESAGAAGLAGDRAAGVDVPRPDRFPGRDDHPGADAKALIPPPEGDDRRPFPAAAEMVAGRAEVRTLIAEHAAGFRADGERLRNELDPAEAKADGSGANDPGIQGMAGDGSRIDRRDFRFISLADTDKVSVVSVFEEEPLAEAKALPADAAAKVSAWLDDLKVGLRKLLTAAAVALGGERATETKALADSIAAQEAFADNFAAAILSGGQPLDGTLAARAESYAASAHAAAEMTLAELASADGLTEVARVLGGENSCSECPDLAALGYVPIDELVSIGDTPCGGRCLCTLEFR